MDSEDVIFNPYNSLNKEITEKEVLSVLKQYGVHVDTVFNMNIIRRAFIHKSYVRRPYKENVKNNVKIEKCPQNCIDLKTKSNERLEFIGDSVLENITRYYIYRRFPKENEGFMTEKKINIVNNEHIGKLCKLVGLDKWFIISRHAEEKGTRNNLKKLGCLFEAFIGALFLVFNKITVKDENDWYKTFASGPGYQMAEIFIISVLEKHVNWTTLIENDKNYKNLLQVKIQKEFKVTPVYIIHDDSDNVFTMGVYLIISGGSEHYTDMKELSTLSEKIAMYYDKEDSGSDDEDESKPSCKILLGTGVNKIKKKAEQEACESALRNIGQML